MHEVESPARANPSTSSRNTATAPFPSTQPASLADLPAYPSDFTFRRFITFAGIVLGYSCFYLTRNSLTYTAPAMVQDATLGIGMKEASGVGRLE